METFIKKLVESGDQTFACPCKAERSIKQYTSELLSQYKPFLNEEDLQSCAEYLILNCIENEKNKKSMHESTKKIKKVQKVTRAKPVASKNTGNKSNQHSSVSKKDVRKSQDSSSSIASKLQSSNTFCIDSNGENLKTEGVANSNTCTIQRSNTFCIESRGKNPKPQEVVNFEASKFQRSNTFCIDSNRKTSKGRSLSHNDIKLLKKNLCKFSSSDSCNSASTVKIENVVAEKKFRMCNKNSAVMKFLSETKGRGLEKEKTKITTKNTALKSTDNKKIKQRDERKKVPSGQADKNKNSKRASQRNNGKDNIGFKESSTQNCIVESKQNSIQEDINLINLDDSAQNLGVPRSNQVTEQNFLQEQDSSENLENISRNLLSTSHNLLNHTQDLLKLQCSRDHGEFSAVNSVRSNLVGQNEKATQTIPKKEKNRHKKLESDPMKKILQTCASLDCSDVEISFLLKNKCHHKCKKGQGSCDNDKDKTHGDGKSKGSKKAPLNQSEVTSERSSSNSDHLSSSDDSSSFEGAFMRKNKRNKRKNKIKSYKITPQFNVCDSGFFVSEENIGPYKEERTNLTQEPTRHGNNNDEKIPQDQMIYNKDVQNQKREIPMNCNSSNYFKETSIIPNLISFKEDSKENNEEIDTNMTMSSVIEALNKIKENMSPKIFENKSDAHHNKGFDKYKDIWDSFREILDEIKIGVNDKKHQVGDRKNSEENFEDSLEECKNKKETFDFHHEVKINNIFPNYKQYFNDIKDDNVKMIGIESESKQEPFYLANNFENKHLQTGDKRYRTELTIQLLFEADNNIRNNNEKGVLDIIDCGKKIEESSKKNNKIEEVNPTENTIKVDNQMEVSIGMFNQVDNIDDNYHKQIDYSKLQDLNNEVFLLNDAISVYKKLTTQEEIPLPVQEEDEEFLKLEELSEREDISFEEMMGLSLKPKAIQSRFTFEAISPFNFTSTPKKLSTKMSSRLLEEEFEDIHSKSCFVPGNCERKLYSKVKRLSCQKSVSLDYLPFSRYYEPIAEVNKSVSFDSIPIIFKYEKFREEYLDNSSENEGVGDFCDSEEIKKEKCVEDGSNKIVNVEDKKKLKDEKVKNVIEFQETHKFGQFDEKQNFEQQRIEENIEDIEISIVSESEFESPRNKRKKYIKPKQCKFSWLDESFEHFQKTKCLRSPIYEEVCFKWCTEVAANYSERRLSELNDYECIMYEVSEELSNLKEDVNKLTRRYSDGLWNNEDYLVKYDIGECLN